MIAVAITYVLLHHALNFDCFFLLEFFSFVILCYLYLLAFSMTKVMCPSHHNDLMIQLQLVQAIQINYTHLTLQDLHTPCVMDHYTHIYIFKRRSRESTN